MTKRLRHRLILLVFVLLIGIYGVLVFYIYRSALLPSTALETLDDAKAKLTEQYDMPFDAFAAPLGAPEFFTVQTNDGFTLSGSFYQHPNNTGSDNALCGLIFLHGSGVNRINSLHFVHTLWERGCDLVIYDQRTWGESEGDYVTYGFYEKQDLLIVTNWLQEKSSLTESQIAWAGISLGGAVALQAAPLAPDIAFILADSSYQDLRTAIGDRLPSPLKSVEPFLMTPVFWLLNLTAGYIPAEASPYLAAQSIASPVLLIHSQADTATLPYNSVDIASQLDSENHVLHLTEWGSRHGWDSINFPDDYKALVDAFIDEYVGNFGLAP
ncbi:MAG: alpha/beta fold hydrolase [Chloroflexota bacterium]